MQAIVEYWVAGHITTFFYSPSLNFQNDPLDTGSFGAGFNLESGVTSQVSLSSKKSHEIYFDDIKAPSERTLVTTSVLRLVESYVGSKLPPLRINHRFQVPLNSGFGTSAAGAIGLVFSINKLLEFRLDELTLWQLAHKAEIVCKSGLGDVLGLFANAPFEFRIKQGAPGRGQVKPLFFDMTSYDLYTITQGQLSTERILTDPQYKKNIIKFGIEAFERFQRNQSLESLLKVSIQFCSKLNLLSDNLKLIQQQLLNKGYFSSQIMLGDGLFVLVPKKESLQFRNSIISKNKDLKLLNHKLTEVTLREIF